MSQTLPRNIRHGGASSLTRTNEYSSNTLTRSGSRGENAVEASGGEGEKQRVFIYSLFKVLSVFYRLYNKKLKKTLQKHVFAICFFSHL